MPQQTLTYARGIAAWVFVIEQDTEKNRPLAHNSQGVLLAKEELREHLAELLQVSTLSDSLRRRAPPKQVSRPPAPPAVLNRNHPHAIFLVGTRQSPHPRLSIRMAVHHRTSGGNPPRTPTPPHPIPPSSPSNVQFVEVKKPFAGLIRESCCAGHAGQLLDTFFVLQGMLLYCKEGGREPHSAAFHFTVCVTPIADHSDHCFLQTFLCSACALLVTLLLCALLSLCHMGMSSSTKSCH